MIRGLIRDTLTFLVCREDNKGILCFSLRTVTQEWLRTVEQKRSVQCKNDQSESKYSNVKVSLLNSGLEDLQETKACAAGHTVNRTCGKATLLSLVLKIWRKITTSSPVCYLRSSHKTRSSVWCSLAFRFLHNHSARVKTSFILANGVLK